MPKRWGIVFIVSGAMLMIWASLLFLSNREESAEAGEEATAILSEICSEIIRSSDAMASSEETESSPLSEKYLGFLSIPALELQLPVMKEWSDELLQKAPCRHTGSIQSGDLIIAGHNYITHFGYLYELKPGDKIFLTDMNGKEHAYTVSKKKAVDAEAVSDVLESGYPLVLYTCTYDGSRRTTVFCETKKEGTP